MRNQLEFFKDRKFIGVAELAAAATGILENSDSQQGRGTVKEYPDERTVRFYLSEGLIPSPSDKQGTASVFGYLHLLALLAVKKLQAESIPIRKIREIINGRTENELEKLIGGSTAEKNKDRNQAQQFLESLLLEPLSSKRDEDRPNFSRLTPSQGAGRQKAAQKWKRFVIDQGLELHVEESFRPPFRSKELADLMETIRQIIRSVNQK